MNLLEADFCHHFASNNLRFQYQEGYNNDSFELLKKRDHELYSVLKKQIDNITKATPEYLEKYKDQILQEVFTPVEQKLEAMSVTINCSIEDKFRKMQVKNKKLV